MIPMTWGGFPPAPLCGPEQTRGYAELFDALTRALCELTGLRCVSLQPNRVLRANMPACWPSAPIIAVGMRHIAPVCLIPSPPTAPIRLRGHGGMHVVVVRCDAQPTCVSAIDDSM